MVFGHIGEALGHQPLDQVHHLGDMRGGAGLHIRIEAAERLHIGLEDRIGLLGQLADGDAALGGARVDLVIDVRDVADIGDGLRAIGLAQQAVEHVEDDDGAGVADMGEVIDRGAADIHAHMGGIDGAERLLRAGECIVKP